MNMWHPHPCHEFGHTSCRRNEQENSSFAHTHVAISQCANCRDACARTRKNYTKYSRGLAEVSEHIMVTASTIRTGSETVLLEFQLLNMSPPYLDPLFSPTYAIHGRTQLYPRNPRRFLLDSSQNEGWCEPCPSLRHSRTSHIVGFELCHGHPLSAGRGHKSHNSVLSHLGAALLP